ncbi:MAG TPA: hypothetical protein DEB39_12830 [Planctomycetaceae bacterium]|nr:hypothetical protein [Planctomycetaceae bacterium]
MRPKEMIAWISPADLAPWNGAEVPVRFVFTERSVEVWLPTVPDLKPEELERLRTVFSEIESALSPQSREILWLLLHSEGGKATRKELLENVWVKNVPTSSTIRKAIHVLNEALMRMKFGYVVRGSREEVYRLCPYVPKRSER